MLFEMNGNITPDCIQYKLVFYYEDVDDNFNLKKYIEDLIETIYMYSI